MYAGVDKYGGALAGEGQPRGGNGPSAPTGLSLEEAIDTASAEETVVVDVPYSYLEDENDPSSVVSGVSSVLLAAQLNPQVGGLMWIEQENTQHTYKNVVAMSQMTSMLRDHDRNRCYERGIQQAISTFQQIHGRAPIVLDIGAGTGLLSMYAARHGAEHVYACEMFKPMAEIAMKVTQDNFPDKITVFAMRSTDLIVAGESEDDSAFHLPQRADMLVSELFDSILLGEAVIPTIRHAKQYLLTPTAVIIPERATVYAQIIQNESAYRFNSFAGQTLNGVRLARNDQAWACSGGRPALPIHIQAIEHETTALSEPTSVLTFDFTSLPNGVDPLPVETTDTQIQVKSAGQVHAIVMWWTISFDPHYHLTYSTEPGVQNWQDHWVQVLYPLSSGRQVVPDDMLCLRAHHDDLRIWFDVESVGISSIITEKPRCICGLHLVCNAERISMLTNEQRSAAFDTAIHRALLDLSRFTSSQSITDVACLDIGDGSLCALVASSYGARNVTSIESKDVSSLIFGQICDANHQDVEIYCCGCKGLGQEHMKGEQSIDLLVGEPFFYSMQNLSVWQALNFWLRRSALSSLLSPHARILPASARIIALPVVFEHLHECFGQLGSVSGFNHSSFDHSTMGYETLDFPFPVYMYPYQEALDTWIELAAWSFQDTVHSLQSDMSVVLTQRANAVIVWVEYALDPKGECLVTTGPRVPYAKQVVRFLPPAPEQLQLHASFAFHAMEGRIEMDFTWQ